MIAAIAATELAVGRANVPGGMDLGVQLPARLHMKIRWQVAPIKGSTKQIKVGVAETSLQSAMMDRPQLSEVTRSRGSKDFVQKEQRWVRMPGRQLACAGAALSRATHPKPLSLAPQVQRRTDSRGPADCLLGWLGHPHQATSKNSRGRRITSPCPGPRCNAKVA